MIKVLSIQIAKPFLILALIELCIIAIVFYMGVLMSWAGTQPSFDLLIEYWPQATIFTGVIVSSLFAMGLYEGLLTDSFSGILVRLGLALCLGFAVLTAIFYVFPDVSTWRSVTGNALVIAFFGIATAHLIFMNLADFSALKKRSIVIGTGKQAASIQELEKVGRAYGFTCVGFIGDDDQKPAVRPESIVEKTDSLLSLVETLNADEIVIALEDRRNHVMMDELAECGFRGVPVIDYGTFWERETKRIDLNTLTRNWILMAGSLPGGRIHHLVMRIFDLSVSIVTLVFLAPVIVGATLAVKLGSSGPIFYRQDRVGLRGRSFGLLKFRSMEVDAESDGVPRWSQQNDHRVTMIGAFLRKTRIDELPQILNVLKGEMKFVGPRPERPYFVEQLAKEIPFYRQRFQVKPGITGWAQLNYPYGASIRDARAKLEYDLYYIKNYSLLLDLMIVIQTIRVIFWPIKMVDADANS